MKLYLVRHGQTDFNAGKLVQGASDIPLNETGKAQARELSKIITPMHFDAHYVSPLLRARQTAEIITSNHAEFIIDELLRERYYGELEGTDVDLHTIGDIFDRQINLNKYGIEPICDLLARAQKFLDKIQPQYTAEDKVLVVAHGALLRAMHFDIVGYDDGTDFSSFRFQNCEMREYDI